jgi:hypothetical protein
MSRRIKYNSGERIGNCVFISETLPVKNVDRFQRHAIFKCNCGKNFECRISHVKFGMVKSCGCLQKQAMRIVGDRKITHGKSYHPLFPIWRAMIQRCQDQKSNNYDLYGGRGISVCDRWLDVNNFIADMSNGYKKGLQIDRIDNNGNYTPENCRWVTRKENCNNRRSNKLIEYKGVKRNITEWTEILGIRKAVLTYRLNNWKDIDKIFNQPPRQTSRTPKS